MTFFKEYIQELVSQIDITKLQLEELIIGIRYTAVKIKSPKNSHLGVSFSLYSNKTLSKSDPHGKFHDKTIPELINGIYSDDSINRSVAIAVLNTLAQIQRNDDLDLHEAASTENKELPEKYLQTILQENDPKIGMIGQIKPVVKLLKKNNIHLSILDEFNPVSLERESNIFPVKTIYDLKNKDHIIVTGSSLVFPNFEEIMKEILPTIPGFKVLIGPSASVYAPFFFKNGFNVIASSIAKQNSFDEIFKIIKSGGGYFVFKKYCQKFTITE